MTTAGIGKATAVAVFGVLLPIALFVLVLIGLSQLSATVQGDPEETPQATLRAASASLHTVNDYILFSQLNGESTDKVVVRNKEIMKIVVMQLGAAVASVGLMFVLLGVSGGGGSGKVAGAGIALDFKISSTGVLVFIAGSAMSTAGGLVSNEYKAFPVPAFAALGYSAEPSTSVVGEPRTGSPDDRGSQSRVLGKRSRAAPASAPPKVGDTLPASTPPPSSTGQPMPFGVVPQAGSPGLVASDPRIPKPTMTM